MPIYEYRCADCRRRVSVFFRSLGTVTDPTCPQCGGSKLTRLMSRVAVHRSTGGDTADEFGGGDEFGGSDLDPFNGMDEDDPRAMAGALRRMSEQTGEPLEPEMEEALGRLEAGEDPDSVMAGFDETAAETDDGLDDEF